MKRITMPRGFPYGAQKIGKTAGSLGRLVGKKPTDVKNGVTVRRGRGR